MRSSAVLLLVALAGQALAEPIPRGGWHDHRSGANYTSVFSAGLSPGASIWYSNQAGYANATVQRASIWDEPSFAVTIKPATEADVQYIIKTANKQGYPFYATGGAHGTETGFANVRNAVNIDLSNFKNQSIDTAGNTVTVQPGLAFYEFDSNVADAGKTVPLGNAYCVNMVGATIGAGVGPYMGMFGLVIDSLLSVRMVVADGSIVTASQTQNPDLFWAVKGAAANFGVIVSATYRIYDSPNNGNMIVADFIIPGSANRSMYELVKSWDTNYPKEMGLTLVGLYNHTSNAAAMSVQMSWFGPQSTAQPIIDSIVALNPIKWRNITVRWDQRSQAMGFGTAAAVSCERGVYTNQMSIAANQTNVDTYVSAYNQYVKFAAARPWFVGSLWLQRFNLTATQSVPVAQQGVYPGRDFASLMVIYNTYDGPSHDQEVYQYSSSLRSKIAATSGFGGLQTYINYAYGDEGPEVWFGKQNLPRLVQLKNKWDPSRKFGAGNPIPYHA